MSNEKISLRLPASAEFGRITRAAAANLATRLGWQAVDIDSLRLAIDEAFAVLIGDGSTGELTVDFLLIDNGLQLDMQATNTGQGEIPSTRLARFEQLTTPDFDTARVDTKNNRVHIIKRV